MTGFALSCGMADEVDPKVVALIDGLAASQDDPRYRDETPAQRTQRTRQAVAAHLAEEARGRVRREAARTDAYQPALGVAVFGSAAILPQLYYLAIQPTLVNLGLFGAFAAIMALGALGFWRARGEFRWDDILAHFVTPWREHRGAFMQTLFVVFVLGLCAPTGVQRLLAM